MAPPDLGPGGPSLPRGPGSPRGPCTPSLPGRPSLPLRISTYVREVLLSFTTIFSALDPAIKENRVTS